VAFYSQEFVRKRMVINNKITQVNTFNLLRCSPSYRREKAQKIFIGHGARAGFCGPPLIHKYRREKYTEVKIPNYLLVTDS
jgi:hypothetical protein